MSQGLNPSERLVYDVCKKSFLSLWSYANPRAAPGKELCDILVVCGPDVIIFSVKHIALTDTEDPTVGWRRWRKKAIEQSANQIYGAEKWLASARQVISADGSAGLELPSSGAMRVHRVAVALGCEGKVPIDFGDLGKGFVHVFDEVSFPTILRELDTVMDFVGYLRAKESLVASGVKLVFEGSEEDLLALYLHNGRSFPGTPGRIIIGDDLWRHFTEKVEVKAKRRADEESYIWDGLIEVWIKDVTTGNLEVPSSPSNSELALRTMAREDRFARRLLGKAFREFIDQAARVAVRARMVKSPSGVVYVFLALPHDEDRQFRVAELGCRCFIARGLHRESTTVIGMATERHTPGKGFSLDLNYLYMPEWSSDQQQAMEGMQRDLGLFVAPVRTDGGEDEYPSSPDIPGR